MRAIIISIGDELVLGQSVDTNSAWLSRQLAQLGIAVAEHVTIGDDQPRIRDQLRGAGDLADIVIATGGLGPTDDDLTRHALADALGTEMTLHQPWLDRMQQFFVQLGRPMAQRNRIQAMIPQGCDVIDNPVGTACGLSARIGRAREFFLPGVPSEMKPMFADTVLPALTELRSRKGTAQVIVTRTLRCFGAGESTVAEMLGPMMTRGRNPIVNCTVSDSMISIRINATAPDQPGGEKLIGPVEDQVRDRLGPLVFGCDQQTLPEVVGQLLQQRHATIATAESCTGGLISKMLTDVAGASSYFISGWVTYSNNAKTDLLHVDPDLLQTHGAVSQPVARQLAAHARKTAATDYALSTTGIAGPGGGTAEKPVGLVFIGLATAHEVIVNRCVFPGNRAAVRRRAAYAALDMLRRQMLATTTD